LGAGEQVVAHGQCESSLGKQVGKTVHKKYKKRQMANGKRKKTKSSSEVL